MGTGGDHGLTGPLALNAIVMPSLTLPAPAKLNLFLQITGRRDSGYHDLQSFFTVLDWGDTVTLTVRRDGQITRSLAVEGVPIDQDITVRAAHALREVSGDPSLGADIGVIKRTPMGGGMGGGSSDAATVLVGLNHLWGLGLSRDQLAVIGLELGADVPFFVHGDSAWVEGIGETITPVARPRRWYLCVRPAVHADTGKIFADEGLTRDSKPVKISDFIEGRVSGNAFESVLRRREPSVDHLFALLSAVGTPQLTGTGSVVFVEFSDCDSAQNALRSLPPGLNAWVAASATTAPLWAALHDNQDT